MKKTLLYVLRRLRRIPFVISSNYLWLSFFVIAKISLSLSRYLSVDAAAFLKRNTPDYAITLFSVNSFKYTELMRYIIACGVLFLLFLVWSVLYNGLQKIKHSSASVKGAWLSCLSLVLLIAGDWLLQKYNSHVHGPVFWSLVAVITVLIVVSLRLYFRWFPARIVPEVKVIDDQGCI